MIRIDSVPRPVRVGVAAASVAGIAALAGCAATTTPAAPAPADTNASSGDAASGGTYADGTYTAEGSYATPESVESITVTLTLSDGVVTDVAVSGEPTRSESRQYQGQFIGGIRDVVVGKPLDEISVSRVAGSSLTSGGFTQALDEIKTQASS